MSLLTFDLYNTPYAKCFLESLLPLKPSQQWELQLMAFIVFLWMSMSDVHCMFQYRTPVSNLFGRVNLQVLLQAQSVKSSNNIHHSDRESLLPQDHQVKPRIWRGPWKTVLSLSLVNSHLSSFWLCSLCVHLCTKGSLCILSLLKLLQI